MGHCNHSFTSSIYHSSHVEHSLWPLLDFLWPQTISLVLLYHWMWKASWSTTVLKSSILQSFFCQTNLWTKCSRGGWCLMDAFRLNYFFRFRLVHSNNRWHKFHGSIRKFFECIDHNLAWVYFWENDVFYGSTYVIHLNFAIVSLTEEPAQRLIQEHCSC